jgi:hypothetical protein
VYHKGGLVAVLVMASCRRELIVRQAGGGGVVSARGKPGRLVRRGSWRLRAGNGLMYACRYFSEVLIELFTVSCSREQAA